MVPPSAAPGLAECVAPLMAALGWDGNPDVLAEHLPLEAGWEAPELLERMEELGWAWSAGRFGARRSADEILLVRDRRGHWALLGGRIDGGHKTFLPDRGTWVTLESRDWRRRFRGGWTFAFEPEAPDRSTEVSPYWLQDFLARHRHAFAGVLMYSLVLAGFGIASPQFIGLLYQEITSMSGTQGLLWLGAGALLFALGEVLFLVLRQTLLSRLKDEVSEVLGREIVRRILRFPLVMSLNLEAEAQALRIREFEDLADLLARPVFRSMVDLPFMVVLLVFLGLTGGVMVLVPVVTILLLVLVGVVAHPLLKKYEQDAAAAQKAIHDDLEVVLEKGPAIQALALDTYWKARTQHTESSRISALLSKGRVHSTFQYFGSAAVSLAGVAAVLTGLSEVLAGTIPPGALMASMMLVWRILEPFRSIFVLWGSLESSVQSLERLGKFMNLPGEERLDPARPALRLNEPSVRVDGLYFKYPTSPRFALANVGFSVPAFGSLAIGGPPGSGKSSLGLVLMGLMEGSSGRILVGDQNVRQFHSISYRRACAYLPARPPVLPASLRQNLKIAWATASDEELLEGLSEAGLGAAFASLPDGLDTDLSEPFEPPRPDFLAALGVVRLLLRPARLWILDTPGAHLGPDLRRCLQNQLVRRRGTITLILLTNDPEFAALADRQARLDQGRLSLEAP